MYQLFAILFALSLTISAQANAETLLDCSLPAGPTARVRVISGSDGTLKLIENRQNTSQPELTRALDKSEWDSKALKLTGDLKRNERDELVPEFTEPGQIYSMSKGAEWRVVYAVPEINWFETGPAHCAR